MFLEKGNDTAGLRHIMKEHGDDFARQGIDANDVSKLLIAATTRGRVIGRQGSRPIYEVAFKGQIRRLAITVGSNGFIVGANPIGRRKFL